MKRIRFTIGESQVWHEIQLNNYELSKEQFKDEHEISRIIKEEQDNCKDGKAKKVEVIDESGQIIAKSPDILELFRLEYK